VTTGADSSKPAIEVITGFSGPTASDNSKPANEVTTGFLPEETLPEPGAKRTTGASEAYREMIELELSRGRNAMGIWQDLVDGHGFTGGYQSVQRLVRKLRGTVSPEARVIMIISDGEGTQAMVQRGYRSFLYILNALSYKQTSSGGGVERPLSRSLR
jgi:hypothetical protein